MKDGMLLFEWHGHRFKNPSYSRVSLSALRIGVNNYGNDNAYGLIGSSPRFIDVYIPYSCVTF
jgi:hypothetical protein